MSKPLLLAMLLMVPLVANAAPPLSTSEGLRLGVGAADGANVCPPAAGCTDVPALVDESGDTMTGPLSLQADLLMGSGRSIQFAAGSLAGDGALTFNGAAVCSAPASQPSCGAIALQRRVQGACPVGQALRAVAADGSVTCDGGLGWSLGGNAGTNPIQHYLGTSDAQPVEIRVGGVRALRIEPGETPNLIGGSGLNSAAPGTKGSVIAGGGLQTWLALPNRIVGDYSFIGGGYNNTAGSNSVVGGGNDNVALGGFVGGGWKNNASGGLAVVGGGFGNRAAESQSVVVGGQLNHNNGLYGFIGGGVENSIDTGWHSVVAGGYKNSVVTSATGELSHQATIGGGGENRVVDMWGTIAGGRGNRAERFATVAGGWNNTALGSYGTVAGGLLNVAGGDASVGGGHENNASGAWSVVPGGLRNRAAGESSLAAGSRAEALHKGAFVWADTVAVPFNSTRNNEFAVRATGGVRFASGVDGLNQPTYGVVLPPFAGAWSTLSDRASKADNAPVDPRDVLASLSGVPMQTWRWQGEPEGIRHLGPMAQDFHAAFGLGADERTISTADADGVALAAIQGLWLELQDRDQHIAALEARLAALEARQG